MTASPDLPKHVAIIMDGNGRWAKARGLPREAGHERGVEALRRTVDAAGQLGIEYLSVFSFSTENWRRPKREVDNLFGLLRSYIRRDLDRLVRNGVHVQVVGMREGVPQDILELIEAAEDRTRGNSKHHLVIAFNYGARQEIVDVAQRLAGDVKAGVLDVSDINEAEFSQRLWTEGVPEPEVLIRTSGERRLSNFFLWQCAYSEFVFVDALWPDFGKSHLETALEEYRHRERRFGGIDDAKAG